MKESTPYSVKIPVGMTRESDKVIVDIDLRLEQMNRLTIYHRQITSAMVLSITGQIGSERNGSWGQIADEILPHKMNPYLMVMGLNDLADLVEIWKRWHLNDLRAGCIHQSNSAHLDGNGNWLRGQEWSAMIEEQRALCPLNYSYGSAWLVEELPDSVIARVKEIGDTYSDATALSGGTLAWVNGVTRDHRKTTGMF